MDKLPRDLRLYIAKLVIRDMDMRINLGIVGKLMIPEDIQAKLESLAIPKKLGKNVYGVKIHHHTIFRGIVDSKFYSNSCECHEFVKEATSISLRLIVVKWDGATGICEVSPIFTDIFPYFSAISE
jgi:hypothetical protein